MADYSLLGSFSTGGASALSGDLITKLKDAESASIVDPIDKKLENWDLEVKKIDEIKGKISDFVSTMKYFELGGKTNVFEQVLADTSGDSVVFDAADTTGLKEGTINVSISQLAQKDVYQSDTFIGITPEDSITLGQGSGDGLSIQVGTNAAYTFETAGKTYQELADEINGKEDLQGSLEKVGTSSGDDVYRLVIKSTNSGLDNTLTITQNNFNIGFDSTQSSTNTVEDVDQDLVGAGELNINGNIITTTDATTFQDLADMINGDNGYSGIDGITATTADTDKFKISVDDGSALNIEQTTIDLGFTAPTQAQIAQNLKATVDGIDYDTASNTIDLQNKLSFTALKVDAQGESSSITISKDTSSVTPAAEAMVTNYNDLVSIITDELNSTESVIENKSTLRTILADVKNMLFASYGADTPAFGSDTDEYGDIVYAHSNVTNNDKNIFSYGFALDKTGHLSLDTDIFNTKLSSAPDDLKGLFVGVYENKGLGTQLKDYLDNLDGYDGLLTNYETQMNTDKTDLEKEKEDEIKSLDTKYNIMAESFSAYGALITQMESSFSGLKMMIQQSTTSSS